MHNQQSEPVCTNQQTAIYNDKIRQAEMLLSIGKVNVTAYDSALTVYSRLAEEYPQDGRVWSGYGRALTCDYRRHNWTKDELARLESIVRSVTIFYTENDETMKLVRYFNAKKKDFEASERNFMSRRKRAVVCLETWRQSQNTFLTALISLLIVACVVQAFVYTNPVPGIIVTVVCGAIACALYLWAFRSKVRDVRDFLTELDKERLRMGYASEANAKS